MKNTAIKIMALIALITALIIPAYAQTTEDSSSGGGGDGSSPVITALPMIQSQDALRNYALGISRFGSRSVNAPTLDWNWSGSLTYTSMPGAYGEEILDKLFSVEFVYRLTNPEDKISGYVYLYDSKFAENNNPNMLFFGYAEYTPADLKVGKPQYNIWMQSIPLPLSNVSSAEVLALDEDGKTANRESLDINSKGQVMFRPWLAGAPNGILVVKFQDGSLVTYDLASPTGEVPVGSHESSAWKVDGHYTYKTGEKPTTVKIIEVWQRPSALLEVIADLHIVSIDVMGIVQTDGKTSFERPVSMVINQQGWETSNTVNLKSDAPTTLLFPKGKWRVRFNWTNFGKPQNIYTGPTDGGKG